MPMVCANLKMIRHQIGSQTFVLSLVYTGEVLCAKKECLLYAQGEYLLCPQWEFPLCPQGECLFCPQGECLLNTQGSVSSAHRGSVLWAKGSVSCVHRECLLCTQRECLLCTQGECLTCVHKGSVSYAPGECLLCTQGECLLCTQGECLLCTQGECLLCTQGSVSFVYTGGVFLVYTGGVSLVHTGGVSCAHRGSLLCTMGECLVRWVNIEAFFAGGIHFVQSPHFDHVRVNFMSINMLWTGAKFIQFIMLGFIKLCIRVMLLIRYSVAYSHSHIQYAQFLMVVYVCICMTFCVVWWVIAVRSYKQQGYHWYMLHHLCMFITDVWTGIKTHSRASYIGMAPRAWFSFERLNTLTKRCLYSLACIQENTWWMFTYNIHFVAKWRFSGVTICNCKSAILLVLLLLEHFITCNVR